MSIHGYSSIIGSTNQELHMPSDLSKRMIHDICFIISILAACILDQWMIKINCEWTSFGMNTCIIRKVLRNARPCNKNFAHAYGGFWHFFGRALVKNKMSKNHTFKDIFLTWQTSWVVVVLKYWRVKPRVKLTLRPKEWRVNLYACS